MAKTSNFSNIINTIQEIATSARQKEIAYLYAEDNTLDGRTITFKGKRFINFGSCSYLGLETDERIKEAGIDALRRYGSQFASSRAYASFPLYSEFEDLLGEMFQAPIVVSTNTTMGHNSVIPIIIEDGDAIILDQQVHSSVQDAAKKLQNRDIAITMIRHSRIDELSAKIAELSIKHSKVWYFIDGVYSMYGDLAPTKEILKLLNDYKKLHLYVDDAHGISWAGKHGTGLFLNRMGLHPKMVFSTSLGKGFANVGGVFVFPNEELAWRARSGGGPLTYSGPNPPAIIGACIATAKIHLSQEIYQKQMTLADKIRYCNELLLQYDLPLIAESPAPIFFIGLGLTRVGYNMVKRLSDDNLYVNLGVFPAVPEACTGIRFAITFHHTKEDIERLVERIAYHLPLALRDEERTFEDIYRAFRFVPRFKEYRERTLDLKVTNRAPGIEHVKTKSSFHLQHEDSIQKIEASIWNSLLGQQGFDWHYLQMLESVFKSETTPENKWGFHYYFIKDQSGKIIVATFFTEVLLKDDMVASETISKQIEELRKTNKYYLTSRALMMGTLLTDGNHLHVNRETANWPEALMHLLDAVWKQQEKSNCNLLYLRDFEASELKLSEFFKDQGFIKTELPPQHVLDLASWQSETEYLTSLPAKKRKSLKKEILEYSKYFEVNFNRKPGDEQIELYYKLYKNVKENNLSLNVFDLPKTLFYKMAENENVDIIELRIKEKSEVVAMGLIWKTDENYYPLILGMNYGYVKSFNTYKQILYQAILQAMALKKQKVFLGFTGSMEKRKLGAKAIPMVAYIQSKDNYNNLLINLMGE